MEAPARADTATLVRHPPFLPGEVVDEFGSAGVVIALVIVDGLLDKQSAAFRKGDSGERPRFRGLSK